MYKCNKCGREFERPETIYDDPSPEGISLPFGHYTFYECPCCGSDDFEEMRECPSCGDLHTEDTVLCGECMEILAEGLERIRDGMGLTEDDFEQAITENYKW